MREYTTVDKSTWDDGPWQHEPDKIQWVDESTDLDCLIHRSWGTGALCGYVGVPHDHAAYRQSYDELDVEVHGGLSYSDMCQEGDDESVGICHVPEPGRPDDVWWFGFDCGHAFDLSPGLSSFARYDYEGSVYREVSYVRDQCRQLAAQLTDS